MEVIALHVPRVRCVDETGGSWAERFGEDEIYLGAVFVLINANRSFEVVPITAKAIGGQFDDKETVNWARDLFSHSLGDPLISPYPKAIVASLVLAEHDSGNGRNDFLGRLADEFRAKLTTKAIDRAIAAARQDTAFAPSSLVLDALKDFAKETLKEVMNSLVKAAGEWAGDDIFPPALKLLDIPTVGHTWGGQRRTSEETVEIVGHQAKYRVSMYWELR